MSTILAHTSYPDGGNTVAQLQQSGRRRSSEDAARRRQGRLRLRREWTRLARLKEFEALPVLPYYVQGQACQGYTHRGQLLGAGIGPGSTSHFLGIDRYDRNGGLGFFFQRVCYDDDAYSTTFPPELGGTGRDVEFTPGVSAFRFVGDFDVGLSLAASREARSRPSET